MFWITFESGGEPSIWATWERYMLTPRREAQVTVTFRSQLDRLWCQEWTPATWTVETGDRTRSYEGTRWSDKSSSSQGGLPWATTFDIETIYTVAVPPLEIYCGLTAATPSQAPLNPKSCEPSPANDDVTEQVHPKRAASKKADEIRKQWIAELEKSDWVPTWTSDW